MTVFALLRPRVGHAWVVLHAWHALVLPSRGSVKSPIAGGPLCISRGSSMALEIWHIAA